jgi:hypothetical protein
VTVSGYVAYSPVISNVVAITLPNDMFLRESCMFAKVTPYKAKEAAIDAAQYAQNSPGNFAFSVSASAMLVPDKTDDPAPGASCEIGRSQ